MVRESLKILLTGCLLFLFLASCSPGGGRNRKLPKSTGQPYEVVLEGDTDSIVTKILTEEVPALPQPEPLCLCRNNIYLYYNIRVHYLYEPDLG